MCGRVGWGGEFGDSLQRLSLIVYIHDTIRYISITTNNQIHPIISDNVILQLLGVLLNMELPQLRHFIQQRGPILVPVLVAVIVYYRLFLLGGVRGVHYAGIPPAVLDSNHVLQLLRLGYQAQSFLLGFGFEVTLVEDTYLGDLLFSLQSVGFGLF